MLKVSLRSNLLRFWRCSRGVTAIEYALIAATIATVIIFTVATVGKQVDTSFKNTASELSGMPGTGGGSGGGGGTVSNEDSGSSGGGGGGTASNEDGGSSSGGSGGASNNDDDDDRGRGGGRGRGRGR